MSCLAQSPFCNTDLDIPGNSHVVAPNNFFINFTKELYENDHDALFPITPLNL